MTPQEEAESLREFPLPMEINGEIISAEDKILPTRIAVIDMDIAELEEKLKDLRSSRTLLLDHAIKCKVFEDARFKIEAKIKYGQRIVDLDTLKQTFPKNYDNYIEVLKQKIRDEYHEKMGKVETTVLLGIADTVFGEAAVKAHSKRPETFEYRVVPKK